MINSTSDLRDFLVQQLKGVASGEVSAPNARSISQLSQQIHRTMEMELKTARVQAKFGNDSVKSVKFK